MGRDFKLRHYQRSGTGDWQRNRDYIKASWWGADEWGRQLSRVAAAQAPRPTRNGTLADCRDFVLALPAREQAQPHWQAAEHGGPFRFIARG